jgi:hypothetical protein
MDGMPNKMLMLKALGGSNKPRGNCKMTGVLLFSATSEMNQRK